MFNMAGQVKTTKKGFFTRNYEKFYKTIFGDDEWKSQIIRGMNIDKYKQEFRMNGVNGLHQRLRTDLNVWTEIEIHIAVIGASGTGKSSFVNSIRGLKVGDPNAAKVGVFETTVKPELYRHPQNKSFVVWDLPGAGTPSCPKEKYLQIIGYQKYDFFIILSKSRFTDTDLWLAREIQKLNKTLLFVHSNIDKDIDDDMEDDPENHEAEKVIQEIKTTTECQLKNNGVGNPKVFLINNRRTDKFDFGKVNNEMLSSIDNLKKESLVLTLSAVTMDVITEKKKILQCRINDTALKIASSQEINEQKRLFQEEVNFYQLQFNIGNVTSPDKTGVLSIINDNIEDFNSAIDENRLDIFEGIPADFVKRECFFERVIDFLPLPIWNKKLYVFCLIALKYSLEILYKNAKDSYDIQRVTTMVNLAATNWPTDLKYRPYNLTQGSNVVHL